MSGRHGLAEDQVAVVTGSTQGIGEAIARELVAEGARVAVCGRDEFRAREQAARIGPACLGVGLDVRSRGSIDEAAARIAASLGEPTILVNNAGVNRIAPAEELSEEDWAAVLDVNLTGVFRCCQAFGARMLAAGAGTIVNITSISGNEIGVPGRAAYGASRAGVSGLTRTLGVEWAPRGVRVVAVAPGPVRTPMVEDAIRAGTVSEQGTIDRTPTGRWTLPEDIARAVVLLASPGAALVVGQTIVVDGGFSLSGVAGPAQQPGAR